MTQQLHNPSVSVALATHQGAQFIQKQVLSILDQSYPIQEIILSDDASRDGTVEIVTELLAQHQARGKKVPELLLFKNSVPLKVTQNFAQAISHATGDVIALCDQDDVWHRNRTEELVRSVSQPGVLLVFSNARLVDKYGEPLGYSLFDALGLSPVECELIQNGNLYQQFLRRNIATGATVMFRRELVQIAFPIPEWWIHDEWLAIVAASLDSVAICNLELTDYRQHDNNEIGMKKLTFARKWEMLIAPRSERNRRLFNRAEMLAQRLKGVDGVPQKYVLLSEEKLKFETARQRYPSNRFLRLAPIFSQYRKGNYEQYGTGSKDALRNLLQSV